MTAEEHLLEACAPLGEMGAAYLRDHLQRFIRTKERLCRSFPLRPGARVLDIGAHWLHQSVLYALDGCAVTALDLPETLSIPEVRSLAEKHAIQLLTNSDLEHPGAFKAIADDTFDLILFTEILEHLTFNPVAMWREIYRVMRARARIVVTTPSHYALRSRLRRWWRSLRLDGNGITTEQILSIPTFGHHWKEYSRRELLRYFELLSPDFSSCNFAYTEEYMPALWRRPAGGLAAAIEHALPFLRPDLYLEIELSRKEKGIVVEPHW